jgi:hypothetical protein
MMKLLTRIKIAYGNWSLTTKFIFWSSTILALFGILIGIIWSGTHTINSYNVKNQIIIGDNNSFIRSPIVQGSSTNITYVLPEDNIPNYSNELSVQSYMYLAPFGKSDRLNVLITLPDTQTIFMKEMLFNMSYKIALCNDEFTDCYIYHAYRSYEHNLSQKCFHMTITPSKPPELVNNNVINEARFYQHPGECYRTSSSRT